MLLLHVEGQLRYLRLEGAVSLDGDRLILLLTDDLLESLFIEAQTFALS